MRKTCGSDIARAGTPARATAFRPQNTKTPKRPTCADQPRRRNCANQCSGNVFASWAACARHVGATSHKPARWRAQPHFGPQNTKTPKRPKRPNLCPPITGGAIVQTNAAATCLHHGLHARDTWQRGCTCWHAYAFRAQNTKTPKTPIRPNLCRPATAAQLCKPMQRQRVCIMRCTCATRGSEVAPVGTPTGSISFWAPKRAPNSAPNMRRHVTATHAHRNCADCNSASVKHHTERPRDDAPAVGTRNSSQPGTEYSHSTPDIQSGPWRLVTKTWPCDSHFSVVRCRRRQQCCVQLEDPRQCCHNHSVLRANNEKGQPFRGFRGETFRHAQRTSSAELAHPVPVRSETHYGQSKYEIWGDSELR